jgi:hypothetical protein
MPIDVIRYLNSFDTPTQLLQRWNLPHLAVLMYKKNEEFGNIHQIPQISLLLSNFPFFPSFLFFSAFSPSFQRPAADDEGCGDRRRLHQRRRRRREEQQRRRQSAGGAAARATGESLLFLFFFRLFFFGWLYKETK